MNKILTNYAQDWIRKNLMRCKKEQRLLFMRIYSHDNTTRHIHEVVTRMDSQQLNRAMEQIQRTIEDNMDNSKNG